MNKILDSFKNKKVRYGSFSTLMIVTVIAILVIVNLVAGRLNLSYDMTANKKYTISQESKDILANIKQDVTLYVLVRTGDEDSIFANAVGQLTFRELLQQYANSSSHINVQFKDPYLYPQFTEKYSEGGGALPIYSVIVESGPRFRVINPNDMITTDYNPQTYQPYVKSIDIEPQVTNAINYVTAENTAVIYTFTNNDEMTIPEALKGQIEMANYDLKTFDIVTEDIPSDCAALFLTQPARDWTEVAADKVKAYLQNDGRAIFAINYIFVDMPNLNSVLEAYGVSLGNYIVIEGDQKNYYLGNPLNLLPNIDQHDLTRKLLERKFPILLTQSSGADTLSVKKNSIKIEPLLTTSSQAYGKVDVNSQTIAKEAGDVDGPINIAVAVTDSYYTNEQHTTKLVFAATSSILDEQINNRTGGGNYEFLIDSLNWLQDKEDSVFIPSKTPNTNYQLTMSQQQSRVLMFVSIFVIPITIIGVGLIVWLRRRYS